MVRIITVFNCNLFDNDFMLVWKNNRWMNFRYKKDSFEQLECVMRDFNTIRSY